MLLRWTHADVGNAFEKWKVSAAAPWPYDEQLSKGQQDVTAQLRLEAEQEPSDQDSLQFSLPPSAPFLMKRQDSIVARSR